MPAVSSKRHLGNPLMGKASLSLKHSCISIGAYLCESSKLMPGMENSRDAIIRSIVSSDMVTCFAFVPSDPCCWTKKNGCRPKATQLLISLASSHISCDCFGRRQSMWPIEVSHISAAVICVGFTNHIGSCRHRLASVIRRRNLWPPIASPDDG